MSLKSKSRSLMSSKPELAALAMSALAGDTAAEQMLADYLAEHYPCKSARFGTFLQVGRGYLFRTATDYWSGILIDQTATELLIDRAAWISETGRLSQALRNNSFEEVEPVPGPFPLERQGLMASIPLTGDPPTEQKPSL